MRIAIFSDVHGNQEALVAVAAAIRARAPDRVMCLGDVSFSGTTNMTFNSGFINRLPPSMSNVWQAGVSASFEVLSWKEVPRQ